MIVAVENPFAALDRLMDAENSNEVAEHQLAADDYYHWRYGHSTLF